MWERVKMQKYVKDWKGIQQFVTTCASMQQQKNKKYGEKWMKIPNYSTTSKEVNNLWNLCTDKLMTFFGLKSVQKKAKLT